MVDENSTFGGFLTDIGEAKQSNANALGIPWKLTHMLLGDANGADPVPDPEQTGLIHQVYRAAINQLSIDPANPAILIAELVLPPNVGGWWIRELGLEDEDGDFVAVANCAPSYKPLLAQGSGRNQVVRMHLILSNTANVELKVDPSVVLATRKYVDGEIDAHAQSRNHPDATTTAKGFMQYGTSEETRQGARTDRAAHLAGVKAAIDQHKDEDQAHTASKITLSEPIEQVPDAENVDEALAAISAFAANRFQNIALFGTPGVYEWPVPEILKAGWVKPWVEAIGAGAAGGSNESGGGGGGGPGGGRGGFFDLTGVDTVTITVGAGGVGVSGSQGGNNGESSSFGSYMTAPGGTGGGTDAGRSAPEGVGGDIPIMLATSGGAALQNSDSQRFASGEGGGPGGRPLAATTAAPGNDGVGPGGGGSGSLFGDTSGSGHAGSVTIKW